MADDDTSSADIKKDEPFKKPVLIGRVGKLPKKAKIEPSNIPEEKTTEKPQELKQSELESTSKSSVTQDPTKEMIIPVSYKEPKWSGLCPDGSDYALEVLKSGSIVERVDLTKQPYFVFGRLPGCDVVMAHPTISRHHCILQYKAYAESDEPPSGWYLFDLGSTHGTFLNKDRLKASHYTRVRVGHQIKFGSSTRTYILVGPDFDCDGESELTVTEIKQKTEVMRIERDRMIQEAIEKREKEKLEQEKRREEQGIDWGMGEDAEDEADLSENPFAIPTNEELYLTDPKKTLRGYFEREGHELNYQCDERGPGQYLCKVELPLDDARGRPLVAEAIHTGKKKEAVVACALEACRILDRAGLLRQAKHESRRRKERDWSADDYYDSDDDNYLDRTGQVENKRRGRMQKHRSLKNEQEALTYDQLCKQLTDLQSKISAEERTLQRLRSSIKTNKQTDEHADDLDQYMASLCAPTMSVKAEISTSKMTLQKLKGELSKTQRLADLARPAHLPPLIKKDDAKIRVTNSVVYGKRIKLKTDGEKKPLQKQITRQEEEFVEEVDSDEEESKSKLESKELNHVDIVDKNDVNNENNVQLVNSDKNNSSTIEIENKSGTDKNNSVKDSGSKIYGPMRPPEDYVMPEDYFNQESDRDLPEIMEAE